MSYRDGDYITMRNPDSADMRTEAAAMLLEQGCRSVRFATLSDGRLQAHGYMAQMECTKCHQHAQTFVGSWCEACNSAT